MEEARYQICVEGLLDPRWSEWFNGFELCHQSDRTTTLMGTVTDGAALFGLIDRVRDARLVLVSVNRIETGTGGVQWERPY